MPTTPAEALPTDRPATAPSEGPALAVAHASPGPAARRRLGHLVNRRHGSGGLADEGGYSLSELMVVLIIIGILALLALPRFMGVATKAKMAEAKTMLRQLHTLQEAYRYEYDTYAADLAALGFEQVALVTGGGTARYAISPSPSPSSPSGAPSSTASSGV